MSPALGLHYAGRAPWRTRSAMPLGGPKSRLQPEHGGRARMVHLRSREGTSRRGMQWTAKRLGVVYRCSATPAAWRLALHLIVAGVPGEGDEPPRGKRRGPTCDVASNSAQ